MRSEGVRSEVIGGEALGIEVMRSEGVRSEVMGSEGFSSEPLGNNNI